MFSLFSAAGLHGNGGAKVFLMIGQYPYNPADIILGYASDWTKVMAKPNIQLLKHVKNLSWIKPADGFYKLNVDDSRSRNGDIGVGGVIKDGSGCWKNGFMINIGSGDVLQAEAWGLFYGIQLALDMQISNLEVESDSAVLINLLLIVSITLWAPL
ncbi:hypothetical protein ACLB2K_063283 [Fragaria x ananassa]